MVTTPLSVTAHLYNFGARIEGVSLAEPLDEQTIAAIRELWLKHQVVYFPDQPLEHHQLEAFTQAFGDFGHDPDVASIDKHEHILEVRREPDEAIAPFGGSWHSDWSFQQSPPSATILHAKVVPPVGGNTHYADGVRAYETLDASLRNEIDDMQAIHSARRPYSHEGYERSGGKARSMKILPNDDAWATQTHPLVRTHPETKRRALWVNPVYTLSIAGLTDADSDAMLARLFAHSLSPEFVYEHSWSANMLTMWDNRCVQHCAQGGYDGHRRVMHRTTVAGDTPH